MQFESLNNLKNSTSRDGKSFSEFSSYFESCADASGIFMWNDVFLYETRWIGEKIAIIVMDTQWLSDYQCPSIDDAKIFALGTLISSIQVLNLTDDIQKNHIKYIHFATEVTKFAISTGQEMSDKCFAHLVFLVREWVIKYFIML